MRRWVYWQTVLGWLFVLCPLAPAAAQLPAGLVWDDGYTFFTVESHRDTRDGKPYSDGWKLRTFLRIWGPVPRRSGFRAVVESTDGAELANYRAEGQVWYTAPPEQAVGGMTASLFDRDLVVGVEGQVNVKCFYINGDDDSETLAQTYRIDVRKVTRVRGTPANPEPDSPEWFVQRHGEVLSTVLFLKQRGDYPYRGGQGLEYYDRNRIEVTVPVSVDEEHQSPRGFIRAFVDGERVDLPNDACKVEQISWRSSAVTFTSRTAQRYRQGPPYQERINFREYVVHLPLTWGEGEWVDTELANISAHPGQWEVQWIEEGDRLRTWRFTVGENGLPVPHAEQAAGLSLLDRAFLVDTEIPAGGAVIDARLVPKFVQQGAFYGICWQTDAGRALAAALPEKGKPWPAEEP